MLENNEENIKANEALMAYLEDKYRYVRWFSSKEELSNFVKKDGLFKLVQNISLGNF